MEHLHAGPEIPPGLLCPGLPLTEGGFAKGEAEDSKELLAWEPPAGARSPGRQAGALRATAIARPEAGPGGAGASVPPLIPSAALGWSCFH